MNKEYLNFPITIYGALGKFNETLSKARCRIFYKGANRNGTFITDKFAEELVSTLHYVPVKGIYENDDYSDHGEKRTEGRVYGIVPEDNNFAWEPHLDEDGVERTYACTDVLLFTALYPEAKEIIGKSQSMELYEPSLSYHMAFFGGQKYVVFEHGSFLGLQVLGNEVEPCFEGASFFSLQKSIEDTIDKIKSYTKKGGVTMKFKLSDSQKFDCLWELLNPEYNEEGDWTCSYAVTAVYDDYVLAYNYELGQYERVYYTKDDTTDSIELGERTRVYIMDITEAEKNTVDTLRALNGGTYDLVSENLINVNENAEKCVEYSAKIAELTENNSTLNMKVDEFEGQLSAAQAQYTELQNQNEALASENEALLAYKQKNENQRKQAVISEYTNKLSDEVLSTYQEKLDEYTVEDLDMHLAYELKKAGVFSSDSGSGMLPKDIKRSSVEQILSRYKR